MRRFESMTGPAATLTAEDRSYLRGQAGSAGSGLLGGCSQSAFGGWFEEGPAVDEVRAELRRLSREAAETPEPTAPAAAALPRTLYLAA